jgi:hypothetical protein
MKLMALIDGPLTISDDLTEVTRHFARWHDALLDGATREAGLWSQPTERFVFRNQNDPGSVVLGARTALGDDLTGKVWAVQMNEADEPGNPNVTAAIAFDPSGRPVLIRQGRLNPNSQSQTHILYHEFARLTGLKRATVTNGDTRIERHWYIVTPLDVSNEEICLNTADFVRACVMARTNGEGIGAPEDLHILEQLYAGDESGGNYTVSSREAIDPTVIHKLQGEVWMRMAALLRSKNISVDKPRHAAGYAVDAEIVDGNCRILVEIKSGASPGDVYGGMGQLLIYRKLLPRLADHRPVLLLPSLPSDPLVAAIRDCGVALCTYEFKDVAGAISVTFSAEFLRLCGAMDASGS